MATIIIKNSSTATSAPTTGDIVEGELAINTVDRKIYSRDNANNIVELTNIDDATANDRVAVWNSTSKKWEESTAMAVTDGTQVTVTSGNDIVMQGGDLDVTGSGTFSVDVTVNGNSVDSHIASTSLHWADSVSSDPQARTSSGWVNSVQVVNAASSAETQPTDIQVCTSAEYSGLTPDANTLYFVV